jgi:hypothetical protein
VVLLKPKFVARLTLGLSVVIFAIYFINVFVGGPLGRKPWMSDVSEMVVLFIAVIFFVAGTLACEAQAKEKVDGVKDTNGSSRNGNERSSITQKN